VPAEAHPLERLFIDAYQIYLRDHFEPKTFWRRTNAIGREATAPMNWIRRMPRGTREAFFEKHRKTFFMTDLFPENEGRFQVRFEDVDGAGAKGKK
jgi:hypothetical protein